MKRSGGIITWKPRRVQGQILPQHAVPQGDNAVDRHLAQMQLQKVDWRHRSRYPGEPRRHSGAK